VLRHHGLNASGIGGTCRCSSAFVILALYTYQSGLRAPPLIGSSGHPDHLVILVA